MCLGTLIPSPAPAGGKGAGTVSGGGSVGGGEVVGHGGGGSVVVVVVVVSPGTVVVVDVVVVVVVAPGTVDVDVVVVVVVTGTQGRLSTGGAVAAMVVGGWVVAVVVGSMVVVSGTVVVVVVGAGSLLAGGVPAPAGSAIRTAGAPSTIAANTARAADEQRRGVDIAKSRRAPSWSPTARQTIGHRLTEIDVFVIRAWRANAEAERRSARTP